MLGLRTRFSAASKVLVGAEAPAGVAAVKRLVQGLRSVFAAVQVLSRLARVLTFAAGEAPLLGKVVPGDVPVLRLARLATVAKALVRPCALVAEAPRLAPVARNWDRPQTVAAVVTSLRTNWLEAVTSLQGPTTVASVMAELDAGEAPALPP